VSAELAAGLGLVLESATEHVEVAVMREGEAASHLREKHGFEILQKPCAPDVLLAALRRATGQPAAV
jgi:hypothetical protein